MTVPLTAKKITPLRSRKKWKASPGKSICHQWFNLNFMNWRKYFLYAKKIQISLFFHWGRCRRAYAACVRWIISKILCRRGETERRQIVENIFCRYFTFFFAYKKYSRRFIKFRLNHWHQMDFPGDAFQSFLNLNSVIFLAVNGTVTSLPVFI